MSREALTILSVGDIALLIVGVAIYLFWAGAMLGVIGRNLEGASDIVQGILADAKLIQPGVDHINRTGGVVAGALPLLYDMAEGIVKGATWQAPANASDEYETAYPASGTRRSRLLHGVGYSN